MKKQYQKPTITFVTIVTNDLCAGSICTTIDLKTIPIQKKKSKTYVLYDSEKNWDSKF